MLSEAELKEITNEILEFNPSIQKVCKSFQEIGSNEIMRVGIMVHHACMDLYGDADHDQSHDIAKWILFFH